MSPIYYAGIGSRIAPPVILVQLTRIARYMEKHGFILRSGGAEGCDMFFERGVLDPSHKQIFLPMKGWRGNDSPFYHVSEEAKAIARQFHPNYDALDPFAQLLMGRNSYQILGEDLKTPVKLVICWTPDGCQGPFRTRATGGTGQAISIAHHHGIPVFNLKNHESIPRLKQYLTTLIGTPHGQSQATEESTH